MLHSFSKTKEALEKVGILLLFLALFCFLSERSITKFLHLKAGMDTGLFENILYNTLHGDFFYTLLGPVDLWHSYFSDHVNLILLLILPYLAYSFLSNAIPNKTPFTHHSFVAVPILFVAFLSGYDFLKKKGKAADWILATCALTFLYLFLSQGPPNKKYNYKEDFLRGSVTKEQVDFLRNYDPEANIVSNVPSVFGNRKIIRVFRGKKYSSEETIILFTGDHLADFDLSPVLQTHSDTHSLRKIGPDIALLEPKKKSPTR